MTVVEEKDKNIATAWCYEYANSESFDIAHKAVLYGLAEGRKEKCLEQNNDGTIRPCEVMKENEQLKISNNALTIQYEQDIAELEAQVEKMKPYCKKLCKNYQESLFMNNDCINGVCRNCNKWEL